MGAPVETCTEACETTETRLARKLVQPCEDTGTRTCASAGEPAHHPRTHSKANSSQQPLAWPLESDRGSCSRQPGENGCEQQSGHFQKRWCMDASGQKR